MRLITLILRLLMGALFIFASLAFFFKLVPQPELTGQSKAFMEGMVATGYLLPLVKITELVCGLAFLTGFFVPLAAVIISPVIINIFLYHTFVDVSGLPVAIFLVIANLLLALAHREKYKPLFKAR